MSTPIQNPVHRVMNEALRAHRQPQSSGTEQASGSRAANDALRAHRTPSSSSTGTGSDQPAEGSDRPRALPGGGKQPAPHVEPPDWNAELREQIRSVRRGWRYL